MVRWVVWTQVVLALIALGACLADQGKAPSYLIPPTFVMIACAYSVFVGPILVIGSGVMCKFQKGHILGALVSVALAYATMLALLPLVQ